MFGAPFARIIVVFNPDPQKTPVHAVWWLCAKLAECSPELSVELRATQHSGHGRDIAAHAARAAQPSGPPILIVSVSGDGGYHDVVNGVMDVPGSNVVCTVLAAGNANDHRRSTGYVSLVDSILSGSVASMDLLKLTVTPASGPATVRYAHSYIGVGVTAAMAHGIEQAGKGQVRELLGVARTLPRLRPFRIERADGCYAILDSLVLANVSKMAKYRTISDSADPADGRFEVIHSSHERRWQLALTTLRAVTVGLQEQESVERYAFLTREMLPLQLDGELIEVPADSELVVESAHQAVQVIG